MATENTDQNRKVKCMGEKHKLVQPPLFERTKEQNRRYPQKGMIIINLKNNYDYHHQ